MFAIRPLESQRDEWNAQREVGDEKKKRETVQRACGKIVCLILFEFVVYLNLDLHLNSLDCFLSFCLPAILPRGDLRACVRPFTSSLSRVRVCTRALYWSG